MPEANNRLGPSVCGEICPDPSYCQQCAPTDIKEMVVDFIMMENYKDIDLDQDPCIFPPCGHFLTMSSMDGRVNLKSAYDLDENELPIGIKATQPFDTAPEMEHEATCPTCRGSLRSINRYGRLVRRILLDESTKRFVSWAGTVYGPLTERLYKIQESLAEFASADNEPSISGHVHLKGTRDGQFRHMWSATKGWRYLTDLKILRCDLADYAIKVSKEETPYARIAGLVETSRRRKQLKDIEAPLSVAQSSFHVMATALLLRADICLLANYLEAAENSLKGPLPTTISVDLSANRQDCLRLIAEAQAASDHEREVEGHIFFIQYCIMEKKFCASPDAAEQLKADGVRHADQAHGLCKTYGGKLLSLVSELKDAEHSLHDGYFVQPVTTDERRAILKAMATEFGRGTGHWYVCRNNHPFSVGECGMPMQQSRCPQCGETVGGRNHQSVDGVSRANDLDEELRRMDMNG